MRELVSRKTDFGPFHTPTTSANQPAPQVKAQQSNLMNALSEYATKEVCEPKFDFDYFPFLLYDMPPLP